MSADILFETLDEPYSCGNGAFIVRFVEFLKWTRSAGPLVPVS